MRGQCEIIQDLLPLYVDGMVKKETAVFIDRHLRWCAKCGKVRTELIRNKNWEPACAKAPEDRPHVPSEEEEKFILYIRRWKRRMGLAFIGIISLGFAVMRLLE
ncbi:zf-HC2 domain-containing protein [Paenibacillus alkalitolerans]|uniref:zf-HC2 domain-containing protein n=1 Tax=Paenibacillus alkalitolerans TaxID=2799335 RepID=UPI0018F5E920|nr:zf-HC2 domain-containing protein [Paenibacillus alkalitolerans]